MANTVHKGVEHCPPLPAGEMQVPCPFLSNAELYRLSIRLDLAKPLTLILIKAGGPLGCQLIEQAAGAVRICINIGGRQHVKWRQKVRQFLKRNRIEAIPRPAL